MSGKLASFGIRLGAHILDAIVAFVLAFIAGFVVGITLGGTMLRDMVPAFGAVAGIVSGWLYYALMESSPNQATLGKMACGLFVTDIRGQRIGFGRASGRYFGRILSAIPVGVGFLMCAWTEKRQCLHDMMAGCIVIRKSGQTDTRLTPSPLQQSPHATTPPLSDGAQENQMTERVGDRQGRDKWVWTSLVVVVSFGLGMLALRFSGAIHNGNKQPDAQGPPASVISPLPDAGAGHQSEADRVRTEAGSPNRAKQEDGLRANQTRAALPLRRVPLVTMFPPELLEGAPKPIKALDGSELPRLVPVPARPISFFVPEGTTLLSKGRQVTSSDDNPIIGSLDLITDGDKEAGEGYFIELLDGSQWVQIDLEKAADIYAVCVWHFHSHRRAYHDVIVQISDDPVFKLGVTTIYNNDYDDSSKMGRGTDPPYVESRFGLIADGRGTKGRYVRLYSNGNTSNEFNHYCEVEVFGKMNGVVRPEAEQEMKTGNAMEHPMLAEAGAKIPKLLDLGSTKSKPCKMMAPILEELKKEYAGKLNVEFIDVWENENAGKEYGVEMIPTQIFYDANARELFRHTGFFSKEDILAKWKELGVDLR